MKDVYLIGNAHLDPVWLWRKPEGMSEVLSTFQSALDRMNTFNDYVFTSACAAYYVWVEKTDPKMFAEIQRRVKERRWSITGGFWIQPDSNLPSGEAFARHALYSQRYFYEKFGIIATVGYNVDSFGHHGMYPQILQQAGMDSYVFMRPDSWENSKIPGSAFLWESPDGSRVSAFRILHGYGSDHWDYKEMPEYHNLRPAYAKALCLKGLAAKNGYGYMSFYGVGNHGGGPYIADLQELEKLPKQDSNIQFSSTRTYFDDLKEIEDRLPVWKTDLQHHASGCYSANSHIKAINRRSENALVAAEQYALMATALVNAPSQQAEIKNAWERVMFNQFHDILPGCTIREAANDAMDAFSAACDIASEVQMLALQRLARKIRTTDILSNSPVEKNGWILWEKEGEGAPLIVFNPHAFPVTIPVQINTTVVTVTDEQGNPQPLQRVRGSQTNGEDLYNTLFMGTIPPWGYRVYHMFGTRKLEILVEKPVTVTKNTLENQYIKVELCSDTGLITSFIDKETGVDYAGGEMMRPILVDNDDADTWAHRIFTFDNEVGEFTYVSSDVLESGPIRCAIRIVYEHKGSLLTQVLRLTEGQRQLEVKVMLNYQEKNKMLKLSFPVGVNTPVPIYSMPSGYLEKEADGMEEPAHKWIALVDKDNGNGLALLNNGRYSFSCKNNDLRMVAARSAIFADHFGKRDDQVQYMDQGEIFFTYALMPCNRKHLNDVADAANLLNRPCVHWQEGHHDGSLPPVYTGIKIDNPQITVQAAKISEDGKSYVVRFLETAGVACEGNITIPLLNKSASLSFRPQEIKTICFPMNSDETIQTKFYEVL